MPDQLLMQLVLYGFARESDDGYESIDVLVRRWFASTGSDERAEEVLNHLERHVDLRRMARNPFLLSLLCGISHSAGPRSGPALPTSRSELYARTMELIFTHHDRLRPESPLNSRRRRQVERLALWLLAEAPEAPRYVFGAQDVVDCGGDEHLLERYLKPARLLSQWRSGGESHHFLHTTFHEYLAARRASSSGCARPTRGSWWCAWCRTRRAATRNGSTGLWSATCAADWNVSSASRLGGPAAENGPTLVLVVERLSRLEPGKLGRWAWLINRLTAELPLKVLARGRRSLCTGYPGLQNTSPFESLKQHEVGNCRSGPGRRAAAATRTTCTAVQNEWAASTPGVTAPDGSGIAGTGASARSNLVYSSPGQGPRAGT